MKNQITIPFIETEGDIILTLELDDILNAGTTSFTPGANVWIRAITNQSIISRDSTRGMVTIETIGLQFDKEEDLVFQNKNTAMLSYHAAKIIATNWLGDGLGAVSVSGKNVQVAQTGYAILRMSYKVTYTVLKLHGVNRVGPVLIWAEDSAGRKGTLQVEFSGEGVEDEPVFVTVRNYCTDLPIAGASVYVDGSYRGTTDAYGRLKVGTYARDSEHTIKVTAAGFKDSDVDALANDKFTVL